MSQASCWKQQGPVSRHKGEQQTPDGEAHAQAQHLGQFCLQTRSLLLCWEEADRQLLGPQRAGSKRPSAAPRLSRRGGRA